VRELEVLVALEDVQLQADGSRPGTDAPGHDFTTELFPSAPHGLFDRSGFPPDLFPAAAWLRGHGLAA